VLRASSTHRILLLELHDESVIVSMMRLRCAVVSLCAWYGRARWEDASDASVEPRHRSTGVDAMHHPLATTVNATNDITQTHRQHGEPVILADHRSGTASTRCRSDHTDERRTNDDPPLRSATVSSYAADISVASIVLLTVWCDVLCACSCALMFSAGLPR
jgi:hypothetical protein